MFAEQHLRSYLMRMAAEETVQQAKPNGGFAALWRFLPMLWPKGELELKVRVIAAVLLVLAGKAATLLMPFAYKAVVDGMSAHSAPFLVVAGLVAGYATARFAGVLSDNLRNALSRRSGRMLRAASRERSSATSMTCRCAFTSSGAPAR